METQVTNPVTPINPGAAAPESPVAPPVEQPKEDIPASRFAALARKQKQAEIAAKQVREERAKLDSEKAELAKWREEQAKPKVKKNPIEALMVEGWTYADASAFVMNDEKPTPEHQIKEVETKFETYKREQEEREAAKLAKEKTDAEAIQTKQIEDFKESINSFIKDKAETYELINLHEAQNLVFDTISAHYDQTLAEGKPVILSTEEASNMVEAYLEERVKASMNTKKLKSKEETAEDKSDKSGAVNAFTSKTLGNASTSTSSNPKSVAKSDDERFERALAAFGKS